MAQAEIRMTWNYVPVTHYDMETDMFYPSVRTYINGKFSTQEVFELACDSVNIAMMFSRAIAEEKKQMLSSMIGIYYGS